MVVFFLETVSCIFFLCFCSSLNCFFVRSGKRSSTRISIASKHGREFIAEQERDRGFTHKSRAFPRNLSLLLQTDSISSVSGLTSVLIQTVTIIAVTRVATLSCSGLMASYCNRPDISTVRCCSERAFFRV